MLMELWCLIKFSLGGGVIFPPPDIKSKFSVENSASNIPDTTWLLVFWPNGLNGTKFGRCFFIGLDLRDSFSRSLLGENGYFIVFWHFRPNFKLILHTSKWILCKQKFWELFISILGSLQHKFYGHLDCLNRQLGWLFFKILGHGMFVCKGIEMWAVYKLPRGFGRIRFPVTVLLAS